MNAAIATVLLVAVSFLAGAGSLNYMVLPTEPMCFMLPADDVPQEDQELSEEDTIESKKLHVAGNISYILSRGDSMKPAIPDGALCKCIPTGDYQKGDIIVFRRQNPETGNWMLIDHRVIWANESHVVPQGDSNEENDGLIPKGDIFCEIPEATQLELLFEKMRITE